MCACAHAETLVLRTGARVRGSIVFQNEEVVILRDLNGARFQYPRAEVQEIQADETIEEDTAEHEEQTIETTKKVSILLEMGAGMAYVPSENYGASVSADLLVGSHHIGDRHIFVGAGVGYRGQFMLPTSTPEALQKYNFLPIQAAVRVPFTEQKHAPIFGLSLGYGVALSKNYLGGLYAGVDFGYRCQLNEKSAIGVVAYTQFQQAQLNTIEVIEGNEYSNTVGRHFIAFGAKLTLYF